MCSSCLHFGEAAQPGFRTEPERSSTCHGHRGARGNAGTLLQPSGFLLTAAEPTPPREEVNQITAADSSPCDVVTPLKPGFSKEWCLPGPGIEVCTRVSGKQSACRYVTHLIGNCCQHWQPLLTYKAIVKRNLWKSTPATAKGQNPRPEGLPKSALSFLTPLNSPLPQPRVY